ncbi:Uncharacterised protein [Chlamydia trachomatis]|nr:Uncharacterised protein [Chlamydia trachomatis]
MSFLPEEKKLVFLLQGQQGILLCLIVINHRKDPKRGEKKEIQVYSRLLSKMLVYNRRKAPDLSLKR